MRRLLPAAVSLLMGMSFLGGGPARAGGLNRPTGVGTRASGLSGAFVGLADDASAVFYNPAGLTTLRQTDLSLGLETMFLFRKVQPPGWGVEKAQVPNGVLPYVFVGGRFVVGDGAHLAFGFGAFNSFGGMVHFGQRPISEGVVDTKIGLYEFQPTVAYEVSRRVHIGASLRIGMGYFSVTKGCGDLLSCSQGRPAAEFMVLDTIYGVAFGYSLGILIEPVDGLRLGVSYRSNMNVDAKGTNVIHSGDKSYDADARIPFPQSLALGASYWVHPKVLLSFQVDWTDNSRFQELVVRPAGLDMPRDMVATYMDWKDSIAVHLGAEGRINRFVTLRGGLSYDSRAVPKETARRDTDDADKVGVDVGVTVHFGRWRIESALDLLFGDLANGFQKETYPSNFASPGVHFPGGILSFHVGAGVVF